MFLEQENKLWMFLEQENNLWMFLERENNLGMFLIKTRIQRVYEELKRRNSGIFLRELL